MRAAWLVGTRRMEVREHQLPAPGVGQVLADVIACGVCGSNLHDWHRPHAGAMALPGAVGHEFVASIAAVGDTVEGCAVGQRIVVDPSAIRGCQACPACRDGATWFCEAKQPAHGYGFATQVLVPAAAAYALPGHVAAELGALVEPLACGVHALRHSWAARSTGRLDGVRVVVLGAGMLGLGAVAAARWLGAEQVVCAAKHPHQAEAAARLGATEVVDAGRDDLAPVLRRLRPQVVVEAVGGTAPTLALATQVVGWRGEVVVLGAFAAPQPVDAGSLMAREIRLVFPVSYAARDGVHDLAVAIEMLAADPACYAPLATHRFPLEAIDDAFATADDKASGAVRVLVTPQER
jgi:threonine dehydrogenase-like Zn-dependent dehydrogenase